MSTITRQPKGVPVGGQFAATSHADPSVQLHTLSPGYERGSIWEAHLDTVMPVAGYNPDPHTVDVPQQDADRQLRASLARMRNAIEASSSAETPYFDGIAAGEAEVAAALSNADADPETIQQLRGDIMATDLAELTVPEVKKRTAAPLSMLRARRLAGYFTARAVEMQKELGAKPSNEWKDAEWIKQGAKTAFSNAAVRFANGGGASDNRYHEERFSQLLLEGETNTDTVIGETFDEGAW